MAAAPSVQDHRERYAEHARRLQTWIGAYGVGLASALLFHFRTAVSEARRIDAELRGDELWHAMFEAEMAVAKMTGKLRDAMVLIAIALGLQVVALMINKLSQLELAHPALDGQPTSRLYGLAAKVSNATWIDWVADIGSVALLVWASWKGLTALL